MSGSSRGHRIGASAAPRTGSAARAVFAAWCLVVAAACSSSTSPDIKPTTAEIMITGTAAEPLRLIVSTDFFETFNTTTGERAQVFNTADTFFVSTLPHEQTVSLTDLGSLVVDVSNPADDPATVRLFVELDSGQPPYDREATMSEGGALRYVFNYVSPEFELN